MEHKSVTRFRDYLRIKTVQPDPDYDQALDFLKKIGDELCLEMSTTWITPKHPMLLMTWKGSDPSLPSLLLTSHMDVVPVYPEHWTVDPFSAEKLTNGDIIARGTQDMKSVSIQYLEAVEKLKQRGFQPLRTIHILFTCEEEIGSFNGMLDFVKLKVFRDMNVGCTLDEGLASPDDELIVYLGEKANCSINITCEGNTGHGSQLIDNSAAVKLRKIIDKFTDIREDSVAKVKSGQASIGEVIVCNLTVLEGGIQLNIVPEIIKIKLDIRTPPSMDVSEVTSLINGICSDEGVSWSYYYDVVSNPLHDPADKWCRALTSVLKELNLSYRTDIFPAATDSRFIRKEGVPAYGFSPMNNTPVLLHCHNEFLNENVFLRGIDIYVAIIECMANLEKF